MFFPEIMFKQKLYKVGFIPTSFFPKKLFYPFLVDGNDYSVNYKTYLALRSPAPAEKQIYIYKEFCIMNKDSFSYKKGFRKGIEIYTDNLRSGGYFADSNNKRTMNNCRSYADKGFKNNIRLTENQTDYYYGLADGIEYKYKSGGTPLSPVKQDSPFERREREHYYSKAVDDEIFG